MALPNYIAPGLYINGLYALIGNGKTGPKEMAYSGIGGGNVIRNDAMYTATYKGAGNGRAPALEVKFAMPGNFIFVKNKDNHVTIGIKPAGIGSTHAFSDNYGGCEWHIASNGSAVAFLHVYRGGGLTMQYQLGGGWALAGSIQSSNVTALYPGQAKNISSYAYIQSGTSVVDCCFLVHNQQGMVTAVHEVSAFNV